MKEIEFKQSRQEKDIGVFVDDQLKFEYHMYEKIKKANNIMGLIRHSFIHLDESMFKKLYKALVRPHTNAVWNPMKMKDITSIENGQRHATKYLPTLKNMIYQERTTKTAATYSTLQKIT